MKKVAAFSSIIANKGVGFMLFGQKNERISNIILLRQLIPVAFIICTKTEQIKLNRTSCSYIYHFYCLKTP